MTEEYCCKEFENDIIKENIIIHEDTEPVRNPIHKDGVIVLSEPLWFCIPKNNGSKGYYFVYEDEYGIICRTSSKLKYCPYCAKELKDVSN